MWSWSGETHTCCCSGQQKLHIVCTAGVTGNVQDGASGAVGIIRILTPAAAFVPASAAANHWQIMATGSQVSISHATHGLWERERVYFPHSNNNWISTQQKCKIRRVARKALGPSKLATHDELLPGGGVVSWEMMEVRALIVHIGCQCICPCRANLHKWGFAQSLSYHRPCTTLLTSASAGPCANNLHLIPDR